MSTYSKNLGILSVILLITMTSNLHAQTVKGDTNAVKLLIDKNVLNAGDENEKEIIELWTAYLQSGEYKNPKTTYWDTTQYRYPDYFLWPVSIKNLKNRKPKVQCTLLGIFPVENDHYALKTSLSSIGAEGQIVLEAILSVYAKKVNGKYLLVNSSQYHQQVWNKVQVGKINYYVHPEHDFDQQQADEMNAFNQKMAKLFDIPALSFDYFVSNYSREIVRLWGYDYMAKIYIPGQTGGVADIGNGIVYAGNNSEYYPHELVHLYTIEVYPDDFHFWLNEGFATFMGGSGGHDLDWHIEKLREYIIENPDFEISFETLKGYIPNGLHSTEFRYVIGGVICKQVYQTKGMVALMEGLETVRTDDGLYQFIEDKLNVKRADFSKYICEVVRVLE